MQFSTYKAAAVFARKYAHKVNSSARIVRNGDYWRVEPLQKSGAVCDAELDAIQRAEGRSRYLDEIAETVAHLRAVEKGWAD